MLLFINYFSNLYVKVNTMSLFFLSTLGALCRNVTRREMRGVQSSYNSFRNDYTLLVTFIFGISTSVPRNVRPRRRMFGVKSGKDCKCEVGGWDYL